MKTDIEISIVQCAHCGIPFGMPTEWEEQLRKCHNTFYCPHGHPQSFRGETEEERLRGEVKKLKAAEQKRQADLAKRRARRKAPKGK